jgi:GNAT superfamily N-acetyltransferase
MTNPTSRIDALKFAAFDAPPEAVSAWSTMGWSNSIISGAAIRRQATGVLCHRQFRPRVGGAVGRTWGRCCELLQLWVEEDFRSMGIGTRLLRQFEEHARQRGCDIFYLTTLSFQAPVFYRKHGYTSLAEISGYPDGITSISCTRPWPDLAIMFRARHCS